MWSKNLKIATAGMYFLQLLLTSVRNAAMIHGREYWKVPYEVSG